MKNQEMQQSKPKATAFVTSIEIRIKKKILQKVMQIKVEKRLSLLYS